MDEETPFAVALLQATPEGDFDVLGIVRVFLATGEVRVGMESAVVGFLGFLGVTEAVANRSIEAIDLGDSVAEPASLLGQARNRFFTDDRKPVPFL